MAICNIKTSTDADFNRAFTYQSGSPPAPVNLTGAAFVMKVRRHATDATADIELSSSAGGGITITDAVNGKFAILIAQAKLAALAVGDYEQSLVIVWPSGQRTRIWNGTLTNIAGASR